VYTACRALDFLWLCCGYGTRRPRNLEAFCEGLKRSTQLFIRNLAWRWGLWYD
jgi:hypothetical protein